MKSLLFCFLFLLSTFFTFGQAGYSLEGTVGSGTSRSPQAFSLWLEGKTHFNTFLSAGVGLGLWQTGYKDSWISTYTDLTATHFRLSDNQTMPAFNLSVRGEFPLFDLADQPLRIFLEPQLIVFPFNNRTVILEENYLLSLDPNTDPPTYLPRPVDPVYMDVYPLTGAFQLGWALKGGFVYELNKHLDYFLALSHQAIDPFAALKNKTLTAHERGITINLDSYRPKKTLLFLHLGFAYRFE